PQRGHTRPFAKRSFATKSSIFKDFTKAGLKSIVLRLSCSATVNLPIISNASLIVGISNYLLRRYCFLLLLYAISRQKSTICCDRAINKRRYEIIGAVPAKNTAIEIEAIAIVPKASKTGLRLRSSLTLSINRVPIIPPPETAQIIASDLKPGKNPESVGGRLVRVITYRNKNALNPIENFHTNKSLIAVLYE